jgi:hypothetical protein
MEPRHSPDLPGTEKWTDEQLHLLDMGTKTAIFSLREGVLALNGLGGISDFYPAPFQLLAQGLEHLMKLILWMGRRQQGGTFPEWIALSDEERTAITLSGYETES